MNYIDIIIFIWFCGSFPFVYDNLKYWWKNDVKENSYQDQINILKQNNKLYFYIIMSLISLIVIIITVILLPLYIIDYLKKRGFCNE